MGARIHFEGGNTVIPSDNITGTGTVNRLAKFTAPNIIGDSLIFDNGTSVNNTGAGGEVTNTAFGTGALISNTTGLDNVAIGCRSLEDNTTGVNNAAVGYQALQKNTTQSQNTAMGFDALRDNEGGANSAFGRTALEFNTTGLYNTAVGVSSLKNNITGGNNTATGKNAGRFIADGSTDNETGSQNVFIGADSKANADGDTNEIVIGYNATGNGSNTVTLGNDLITNTYLKGNVNGVGNGLTFNNSDFFKNFSFGTSYISIHEADVTSSGHGGGSAANYHPNQAGYLIGNLKNVSLLNSTSLIYMPTASKATEAPLIKPRNTSLDFSRASTATRVGENGLIESVAVDVPRIDYSNNGFGQLLLEPQRTNLALESESLISSPWFSGTGTENADIAPDGTQSATLITNELTRQNISVTVQPYTVSVFIKGSVFRLELGSVFGSNSFVIFNTSTETFTSVGTSVENYGFEKYINGWYRIFLTDTPANSGIGQVQLKPVGGLEMLIWGAQLEQGSYATSYIPTSGATATRLADSASKTGVSSLIGQTEGTLFVEGTFSALSSDAIRMVTLSDGTLLNRIVIQNEGNTNNLQFVVINGNAQQVLIAKTDAFVFGQTFKAAFAYKANDFAVYLDGVLIGTDTSGTVPSCSKLVFGRSNESKLHEGNINQAMLFKTRLSNTDLAALTTL